jgi:hypothetical protein
MFVSILPSRRPTDVKTNAALDTRLVAERAHQLWVEKGCREGHDLEDWLQAEAEFANGPSALVTHETPAHHHSVTVRPSRKRSKA